jgi:hypothetical protein
MGHVLRHIHEAMLSLGLSLLLPASCSVCMVTPGTTTVMPVLSLDLQHEPDLEHEPQHQ